ncbi:MAG: DsbA family protein [Serratia proteamaculans]
MYKRYLLFFGYTVFIIFTSSFITSAYFHHYVINQAEPESLIFVSADKVKNSPIKDDDAIIEVFSYACHYCEVSEDQVAELEKHLPVGARLIRLHINADEKYPMTASAPLFATLTIMGIEAQHRSAAYQAVIKDNLDLTDEKHLSGWLKANGIDEAEYAQARGSEPAKQLLDYMTAVSRYYPISATPSFIVNKKWLAVQDREFPAFSEQLLSLMQHDKPLEP